MKKRMNRLMSFALLSLLLMGSASQKAQAQDVTVSYQEFYDNLAPYGQWVTDPQYGNVWVPNEGGDFRPYGTRGHWVMTDYGNTWVSEDPWGWACYHYGRWTYDPYYGWVWIPGYEWAPAWVSWRFGGGYSGWAPLGPGAGLSYECPVSWWVFVEPQYMYGNDCYNHWRGPSYNNTYISHTTIINNYYVDNGTRVRYNYGPRSEAIRQVTHRDVTVYHVSQSNRPGAPGISGNRVSIYRPAVNRSTVSSARPSGAMAAPRAISAPHEQRTMAAATQPAFRQAVQNHAQNNGGGTRAAPGAQQQPGNRPQQQGQPMQQQRTQPQQGRPAQQEQRPQPVQQQRPQPQERPMPQQQRPQPQERPMPQQQRPQPQERPMPQQQRPQSQERPMPQQQRPQPQERPMPQQQRPQPQERPMPQQQRPQPQERPMPQQQPHNAPQQVPHEGGRRL